MAPGLEQMAEKYGEKVVIVKMDLSNDSENSSYAAEAEVKGIPALDFFINGQKVERVVGGQETKDLEKIFDGMLEKAASGNVKKEVLVKVSRDRLPPGVSRVKGEEVDVKQLPAFSPERLKGATPLKPK